MVKWVWGFILFGVYLGILVIAAAAPSDESVEMCITFLSGACRGGSGVAALIFAMRMNQRKSTPSRVE